jgi:hypothetical protein
MSGNWWKGLNDCWSERKTVYLASSAGEDPMSKDHFMGDLIFHRFFGTDDNDVKSVRVVLVEVKNWSRWNKWLKDHDTQTSLLPLYVHRLEQVIMSRKSFRIVRWVDEYRPFDLFHDPLI